MTFTNGELGYLDPTASDVILEIFYNSSCNLMSGATAGIGNLLIQQHYFTGVSTSGDSCEGLSVVDKDLGYIERRTSVKLSSSNPTTEHTLKPSAIRIFPPGWRGTCQVQLVNLPCSLVMQTIDVICTLLSSFNATSVMFAAHKFGVLTKTARVSLFVVIT